MRKKDEIVAITIKIEQTRDAYERGQKAVEKFIKENPKTAHQYDLELVPAFYTNAKGYVPVSHNGKRSYVRWDHLALDKQLASDKNTQWREVYLTEWENLRKDKEPFSKIGHATNTRKRHEKHDKQNYRIVRQIVLGIYPPHIAKQIEKDLHHMLRNRKYRVDYPLGMNGESELFSGHVTDDKKLMKQVRYVCESYDGDVPNVGFDRIYATVKKSRK